jgi:ATP-dependent Clp protease ATP-binding subunit ClpB
LLEGTSDDGEISSEARNNVEMLLKQSFRPEFLNRLDEIVFYKPLDKKAIRKIVDILLSRLDSRLKDNGLNLSVTDKAKDYIADNGFDALYGARPLKRYIQAHVETLIARRVLTSDASINDVVTVDVDENGFVVSIEKSTS